jgi:hypothetical protein
MAQEEVREFHRLLRPHTLRQRIAILLLALGAAAGLSLAGFGGPLPNWSLPIFLLLAAMTGGLAGAMYFPGRLRLFTGGIPGAVSSMGGVMSLYLYALGRQHLYKSEGALVWLFGVLPGAALYYLLMRMIVPSALKAQAPQPVRPAGARPAPASASRETPVEAQIVSPASQVERAAFPAQASAISDEAAKTNTLLKILGGVALAALVVLGLGLMVAKRLDQNAQKKPGENSAPQPTESDTASGSTSRTKSPPGSSSRAKSPSPAAATADLDQSLDDLNSGDWRRARDAAARLKSAALELARREQVAVALAQHVADENIFARREAVEALAVWVTPASLPALTTALSDRDAATRRAAITGLGELPTAEAAAALAGRMNDGMDRRYASQALKEIGAPAENAVIGLLSSSEYLTRAEACVILETIGGAASIAPLENATRDDHPRVRTLAANALKAARARSAGN